MVKAGIYAEMDKVRAEGGMDGLQAYSNNLADDVNKYQKRAAQFASVEAVVLDYQALSTKMELVLGRIHQLEDEPGISSAEAHQLHDIADRTLARESFNNLYKEALPIVKAALDTGDAMEEEIYFESIEKNYRKAQAAYDDCKSKAVACKEEDLPKKLEAAKKALRAYNASLDVKFKAEEAAKADELVPEQELTEDEVDGIVDAIAAWRKKEEGPSLIQAFLIEKYDELVEYEKQYSNKTEDMALLQSVAHSRKVFEAAEAEEETSRPDQVKGNAPASRRRAHPRV